MLELIRARKTPNTMDIIMKMCFSSHLDSGFIVKSFPKILDA
jgi:hypothetical protein